MVETFQDAYGLFISGNADLLGDVSGGSALIVTRRGMYFGHINTPDYKVSANANSYSYMTSGGTISGSKFLANVSISSAGNIRGTHKGQWGGDLITENKLQYSVTGATDFSDPKAGGLVSGMVLMYGANGLASSWQSTYPPTTYSISNIQLSANQNINMARFKCPGDNKAYVYQAYACGSGGIGISGMYVEMLAGSTSTNLTSIYKTSSHMLQQGGPLAKSVANDFIEIRFMYSGGGNGLAGTGHKYGTAMMEVGIY